MKLISWNVNGIRAALKNGFLEFVEAEQPDVICVQETKAQPEQLEIDLSGYKQFWCSAEKKGYAGTAVFTRIPSISTSNEIGIPEYGGEGRVLSLEFPQFILVNVYTPNAQRGLTRLDYRMRWDQEFLGYLKSREQTKPVVFCGDLNVAHKEIDLANPRNNRRNAGFTDEEREGFSRILDAGFIDTFRHFEKRAGHYTWWSYRANVRAKNIGWRIDYFCISQSLINNVSSSCILSDIMGSDHCPISMTMSFT
jgi:exodeoxyribonuclease III